MGEAVCGMFQQLTPVARTVQLRPRAWPVASMAQRLKPADDLPPELVAQSDLSDIFPESRCILCLPWASLAWMSGRTTNGRRRTRGRTHWARRAPSHTTLCRPVTRPRRRLGRAGRSPPSRYRSPSLPAGDRRQRRCRRRRRWWPVTGMGLAAGPLAERAATLSS